MNNVYLPDMEALHLALKPSEIGITPSGIRGLTWGNNETGFEYTEELMNELIDLSRKAMDPGAALVRIEEAGGPGYDYITLRGRRFRTGKTVTRMLKGSREYALFAATIGPGPEELCRSLMQKGDLLEGYLVDLIGSALVESATNLVHNQIREMAEKDGYRVTNRYSPGYCGWEVSEQQKLFKLLPGRICGITLSGSSLMNPMKSVSGLIGIGPSVTFRDYTCELCSMTHCAFRSVRPSSLS